MQISYLQKVKEQQIRNWFNMMNPNSNGCVNKSTVIGIKLPKSIYEKIGRLVEELIELDEELNFEEFCKAIEILEKEELDRSFKASTVEVAEEFVE